jgi:hypothetical protein
MKTMDALDHIGINDVLCRFFLAFDERDWTAMANCLAPRCSSIIPLQGASSPAS